MADSSVNTGVSGSPIRVLTGLGAGSADEQVVAVGDQLGNLVGDNQAPISIAANATSSGQILGISGCPNGTLQLSGTWAGTIQVQVTVDGSTWVNLVGSTSFYNVSSGGSISSGNISGTGIFQFSAAGMVGVRVITTTYTSGTITGIMRVSSAPSIVALAGTTSTALATSSNVVGSIANISTAVVPGTAATNLGKARAATPATSDTGVSVLGFRAPATPVAVAATAGAYAPPMLDTEGKVIVAGTADSAQSWQATVSPSSTTAAALKAAAATGIRNYLTDLTISNPSSGASVVNVLDGSTVIWSASIAVGATLQVSFNTPLRGTAATAVNVQYANSGSSGVIFSATGYLGI